MSAFAGILRLDRGQADIGLAERMAVALRHQSSDDEGSYQSPDGGLALAGRSAGQPLSNETHDVWLVLDGAIYNHRALRHSLELDGHRFRTSADAEVAHLKMTFSPDGGLNAIAAVNLVRSDFVPELSLRLDQGCAAGQLIVNLRAEAAPEVLKAALETAVGGITARFPGVTARVDHLEHFRPGRPRPTHRELHPA
jgi:hypothetical protein